MDVLSMYILSTSYVFAGARLTLQNVVFDMAAIPHIVTGDSDADGLDSCWLVLAGVPSWPLLELGIHQRSCSRQASCSTVFLGACVLNITFLPA
jgi:hypothetical protein